MAYEFRTRRRVEFAETDMAGIVHFANYFRYMEEAEHAFFRSLELQIHTESADGTRGWARGNAACAYYRPAHYGDELDLHVLVADKKPKSISYRVAFYRAGVQLALGTMTAVHVAKPPGAERLRAADMPPEVDARIQVAPAELLDAHQG
jgi:YbgC/YbaW family acyl-CoA thioester hydrolase